MSRVFLVVLADGLFLLFCNELENTLLLNKSSFFPLLYLKILKILLIDSSSFL